MEKKMKGFLSRSAGGIMSPYSLDDEDLSHPFSSSEMNPLQLIYVYDRGPQTDCTCLLGDL